MLLYQHYDMFFYVYDMCNSYESGVDVLHHGPYHCLVMDSDNVKILLDGDKILQMGGDLEKLAVISDIADVSQDDFLLIYFSHFKVLKETI